MTRRVTVIGVLLATVLAACGSSGSSNGSGSTQGKKYVAAMVAAFDKEQASGSSVPFTKPQATCLSKKIVDAVGVDTLQKNGVTPENLGQASGLNNMGKKLTTAQATKVADAFFDGSCFDMTKLLAKEFQSSFTGQSTAAINCLAGEVVKLAQFKKSMVDSILGKSDSNPFAGSGENALLPAFTKCHIDVSKLGG